MKCYNCKLKDFIVDPRNPIPDEQEGYLNIGLGIQIKRRVVPSYPNSPSCLYSGSSYHVW